MHDHHATTNNEKALALYRQGAVSQCLDILRSTLNSDAGDATTLVLLVDVLRESGQSDPELERRLLQCKARIECNAELENRVGMLQFTRARFPEALLCFQEAIACNPRHAHAWHNLGKVYEKHADFDRAQDAYQNAWSLDPGELRFLKSLVSLLAKTSQPAKALSILDALPTEYTCSHEIFLLRGVCLGELQRYNDAIESIGTSIELAPGNVLAYKIRGKMHLLSDNLEDSLADYRKAYDLNPRDRNSKNGFCSLLRRNSGRLASVLQKKHGVREMTEAEFLDITVINLEEDGKDDASHKKQPYILSISALLRGNLSMTVGELVDHYRQYTFDEILDRSNLTPFNFMYLACVYFGFLKGAEKVRLNIRMPEDSTLRAVDEALEYYSTLEPMSDSDIERFLRKRPIVVLDNAGHRYLVDGVHRTCAMIGRLVANRPYLPFYRRIP